MEPDLLILIIAMNVRIAPINNKKGNDMELSTIEFIVGLIALQLLEVVYAIWKDIR